MQQKPQEHHFRSGWRKNGFTKKKRACTQEVSAGADPLQMNMESKLSCGISCWVDSLASTFASWVGCRFSWICFKFISRFDSMAPACLLDLIMCGSCRT